MSGRRFTNNENVKDAVFMTPRVMGNLFSDDIRKLLKTTERLWRIWEVTSESDGINS